MGAALGLMVYGVPVGGAGSQVPAGAALAYSTQPIPGYGDETTDLFVAQREGGDAATRTFNGQEVQSGQLASWSTGGGNTGGITRVRQWLDQSGNGNDSAAQTNQSRQPRLTNGGVLDTGPDGNFAAFHEGVGTANQYLVTPTLRIGLAGADHDFSIFMKAAYNQGTAPFISSLGGRSQSSGWWFFRRNSDQLLGVHDNNQNWGPSDGGGQFVVESAIFEWRAIAAQRSIFYQVNDSGASETLEILGSNVVANGVATENSALVLGAGSITTTSESMAGYIRALLIFENDQSQNTPTIESALQSL